MGETGISQLRNHRCYPLRICGTGVRLPKGPSIIRLQLRIYFVSKALRQARKIREIILDVHLMYGIVAVVIVGLFVSLILIKFLSKRIACTCRWSFSGLEHLVSHS